MLAYPAREAGDREAPVDLCIADTEAGHRLIRQVGHNTFMAEKGAGGQIDSLAGYQTSWTYRVRPRNQDISMHIQVNTDSHIHGHDALAQTIEDMVRDTLDRFSDRITRVEIHLSDVNSHKSGDDDIRCMIEARPAGHRPLATSHHAGIVDDAVQGAVEKLERALESTFGRLDQHHRPANLGDTPDDLGE
jgi:ribosome-associated translation inhibitor RaiA